MQLLIQSPLPLPGDSTGTVNADFIPGGLQVIFSGDVDSLENLNRSLESEIFIADRNGKNMRMILGKKDKIYTAATVFSLR
jgi:hypothetical protein